MRKVQTRLPSVELEDNYNFYKKSVEDYEVLADSIEKVLTNAEEIFEKEMPLVRAMKIARIQVELNEVNSRIRVQAQNFEIYETRVEQYKPILEKETKETNEAWDAIWEEATLVSRKFPMSGLAMILNGYPKEQYNPELFSQELKNETAKAIRKQLDSYKAQLKKGGKDAAPAGVVNIPQLHKV